MAKKNRRRGSDSPPTFTFDPAIEAERRAARRQVGDIRRDTKRDIKRGRRDFRTTRKDIKTEGRRGMQDFRTQLRRGLQDIRFKRQDVRTEAQRGRQDFGLQLQGLVRDFGRLGQTQTQAANVAGVLGGGTAAASAAQRRQNLGIARKPIQIGLGRLEEDRARAVGRLGIEARQLRTDIGRGEERLGEDVSHDIGLARRDFRRTRRDLRTDLQRARREQRIGDIDLLQQEIFGTRAVAPGVFRRYKKRY